MSQKQHVMHGRDHRPDGADPIPGLGEAFWAAPSETVLYDTRDASITLDTVLLDGHPYKITVDGTYTVWPTDPDYGTPEPDAIYPTHSRAATEVAFDPDVWFASETPGSYPHHSTSFQINLGSGFSHVEPDGGPYATPQPDHLYTFFVTGEGSAPSFKIVDAPSSDNYGALRISLHGSGSTVPDPAPEPDGRWLRTLDGAAVWADAPAADITITDAGSHFTATNVEGALQELASAGGGTPAAHAASHEDGGTDEIDLTDLSGTPAALGSHLADTSDAHDAAAISFSPTGTVASTDVQAAIAEVALEAGGTPPGATTKVFDSTLGADAASIDSGAGSIPGGYDVLEIWMLLRTTDAGATANADIILNNDTSALYDRMAVSGVNATASAGNTLAATQWQFGVHGSGGGASYASYLHLTIPAYAQTSFFKSGTLLQGRPDSTAGNNAIAAYVLTYKSTAAITRIKVAATGAASLKTGSRLVVYAR